MLGTLIHGTKPSWRVEINTLRAARRQPAVDSSQPIFFSAMLEQLNEELPGNLKCSESTSGKETLINPGLRFFMMLVSSADLEGMLARTGCYIIQHYAVISRTRATHTYIILEEKNNRNLDK